MKLNVLLTGPVGPDLELVSEREGVCKQVVGVGGETRGLQGQVLDVSGKLS